MLIMNSCSSQKYQFVIQAINQHQPKMIIITLYMHPMAQRMLSWKPKTLICPMTNVHWFNREKLQTRDKIIKIYFFSFSISYFFLFRLSEWTSLCVLFSSSSLLRSHIAYIHIPIRMLFEKSFTVDINTYSNYCILLVQCCHMYDFRYYKYLNFKHHINIKKEHVN